MTSTSESWEHSKIATKREFKKFVTRKWSGLKSPLSSGPSTPALEVEDRVEVEMTPEQKEQERLEITQQLGPFQYEAIPDKGHIRLLELLPAPSKEHIQVRLSSVSLEESAQTYDALSYVWGDPDQPRRCISVNGCHLEIYESLYGILSSLRPDSDSSATSSIVLWVDAICINQTNVAERNAQVPIMDSIYRNARRTVIWLGPETKDTKDVFEMLQHLAQDSKTAAIDPTFSEQETLPLTIMQFSDAPRVQSSAIELYAENDKTKVWPVLKCAWWYRSWTLQEILLSTNITFFIGRYKMEWEDLCAAVDHGFRLHLWRMLFQGTFVNPDILPYLTIRDLRRRLGLYGSAGHGSCQSDYGPEILLTLLEGCRQRESKDPRDKIYAVSGILKNIQRLGSGTDAVNQVRIHADYASPVVYVYRMMSQQLILTTKTLDVLGISPKSSRRGLPSWVTDWSNSTSTAVTLTRDALGQPRRTHAARNTLATTARFPEDAVTLVLRGHEVATVAEISNPIPRFQFLKDSSDEDDETTYTERRNQLRAEMVEAGQAPSDFTLHMMVLKEAKDEVKGIVRRAMQHFRVLIEWERFAARKRPTNPDDGSLAFARAADATDAVYWKTLCAGTYDHADPGATEALYREWSRSLEVVRKNEKRYGDMGQVAQPFTYSLQAAIYEKGYSRFGLYCECAVERRLGWCGNGWLALLPEGVAKGDRIILAEGGRVPLVLRPDGDGYNTFIGEAYVHGIMNGEAFKQSQCEDIKIC